MISQASIERKQGGKPCSLTIFQEAREYQQATLWLLTTSSFERFEHFGSEPKEKNYLIDFWSLQRCIPEQIIIKYSGETLI